jgi:hypothetical protein
MTPPVAIDLPLERESGRRAREHLEVVREELDEQSFFDLRLLVSELVIEALHADADAHTRKIELRAEACDGGVRVDVAEGGEAFQVSSRRPDPGDQGWGVYLVQRLSSRWALRRDSQKSSIWFEVLRAQEAAPART